MNVSSAPSPEEGISLQTYKDLRRIGPACGSKMWSQTVQCTCMVTGIPILRPLCPSAKALLMLQLGGACGGD